MKKCKVVFHMTCGKDGWPARPGGEIDISITSPGPGDTVPAANFTASGQTNASNANITVTISGPGAPPGPLTGTIGPALQGVQPPVYPWSTAQVNLMPGQQYSIMVLAMDPMTMTSGGTSCDFSTAKRKGKQVQHRRSPTR